MILDIDTRTGNHPNPDLENEDGCDTDEEFYSDLMEVSRPTGRHTLHNSTHAVTENDAIDRKNLMMMTSMETTRSYAIQALALSVQEWDAMGQSSDPTIAETSILATATTLTTPSSSSSSQKNKKNLEENNGSDDEATILEKCIHRVTSLLLVRIVAIVLHRQQQQQHLQMNGTSSSHTIKQKATTKHIDLSTSGICRQILIVENSNHLHDDDDDDDDDDEVSPWSFLANDVIVQQLEQYVRYILRYYATSTQLPFHNRTHAVTVVTNCNKLIDFLLDPNNHNIHHECSHNSHDGNQNLHNRTMSQQQGQRPVITYGLRNDPLLLFALLFAALIHDVQHEGKLNSQLVQRVTATTTSAPHTVLIYNDQSVQEMRSLHIAFEEFLKDDYTDLRNILFQNCPPNSTTNNECTTDDTESNYRYFRNAVISAVLSTDLSSPERMAVSRSKWKEAFFVVNSPHNPNVLHPSPPPPQQQQQEQEMSPPNNGGEKNQYYHRRASAVSHESKPRMRSSDGMFYHRRGSNYSEMSEITTDEGNESFVISESVPQHQSQFLVSTSSIPTHRRNSVTSEISAGSYQQKQLRQLHPNKGPYPHYRQRPRSSSDIESDDESSEVAVDSVALMYKKQSHTNNYYSSNARYAKDEVSVDSVVSDTIDSYVLRTTKAVKVKREMELNKQKSTKHELENVAVTEQLPNGNIDIPSTNGTMVDHPTPQPTLSAETDGSTSFVSYPTGSIAVIQKRLDGAPKTRRRVTDVATTDDKTNDDIHVGNDIDDEVEPRATEETKILNVTRNTKCAMPISTLNRKVGHSLSPPSSDDDDDDVDHEYEQQRKELYSSPPSKQISKPIFPSNNYQHNYSTDQIRNRMITRRASTGAISRFGSLTDLRIDENHPNNGESNVLYGDYDQKDGYTTLKSMNVDLPEIPKYRKRLGIRRSMDLSGEAIEFYPRRTSIGNLSNLSGNEQQDDTNGSDINNNVDDDDDEAEYIKASAIIEALLRMADVGHFYQNWQNMTTWSARMFQERMHADESTAKQDEIYTNWYNNQILIIDSYLKPLAVQLNETGVLGERHGGMLVQNIEEIRRHWMIYGYEWCQKLINDV